MGETRKLAAILVSDVVGYSRLAGADEDRTLSRLRGLRSDLIDPAISAHHGRIVKRTGDGSLIEFRSVVDAVRCAIEVQNGLIERNAGLPPERRIEFRVGVHLGDVVEEADGDLMGDGVNIAARLEGICEPGAICLSEDAYRQVKGRLDLAVSDLGPKELKNIGQNDDERGEAVRKLTEAAEARRSDEMSYGRYGHDDDETASLRKRLRAAGVPVGMRGDAALLRRVAAHHGVRLDDAGMAGDSAASIRRMFPGMKLPRTDGCFAVSVRPETRDAPGAGRGNMALDSLSRAYRGDAGSLRRMFPDVARDLERIRVVG